MTCFFLPNYNWVSLSALNKVGTSVYALINFASNRAPLIAPIYRFSRIKVYFKFFCTAVYHDVIFMCCKHATKLTNSSNKMLFLRAFKLGCGTSVNECKMRINFFLERSDLCTKTGGQINFEVESFSSFVFVQYGNLSLKCLQHIDRVTDSILSCGKLRKFLHHIHAYKMSFMPILFMIKWRVP